MKLTTQIARRFLLGGKGSGPSRVTGWVSILGMAVGSFALVVSVAVLNGFESIVQSRVMGFEGDLRITGDMGPKSNPNIRMFSEFPEIETVAPFMERKTLIQGSNSESRMVDIKAVDLEELSKVYQLGVVDKQDSAGPGIYLGSILADRLGAQLGDRVTLFSPVDGLSAVGTLSRVRLPVTGIFKSNVLDYDDKIGFIPWETGLKLFTRKTRVDGADLRIKHGIDLGILKNNLKQKLPEMDRVESWSDLHENLFHAMRMERIGAMVILSLIIVVAAFNLATTLILVTFQKIREIGILETLGMTAREVNAVLLKQGFLIGGSGLAAGFLIGILLVVLQSVFGLIPLPTDIYALSHLPMILYPRDVGYILIISIFCIWFAAHLAGKRAGNIEPKDALQMEK